MDTGRIYKLMGADGRIYESAETGTLGGHRGTKIYGRLDCRSARAALEKHGYKEHRVFFADEATAIAAGFRPCHTCLPKEYAAWKAAQPESAHVE